MVGGGAKLGAMVVVVVVSSSFHHPDSVAASVSTYVSHPNAPLVLCQSCGFPLAIYYIICIPPRAL